MLSRGCCLDRTALSGWGVLRQRTVLSRGVLGQDSTLEGALGQDGPLWVGGAGTEDSAVLGGQCGVEVYG